MAKLKFRNLNPNEIEVRIAGVNKGGVQLLLYKNARCDQAILDETVGPLNWQKSHNRDNANCVVSIWDKEKSAWVSKEDTGFIADAKTEIGAKGLASDSFKRTCSVWGIGRELYTAPDIFIFASDLKGYVADVETETYKCSDKFIVQDIKYEEDTKKILEVTIGIKQFLNKPCYAYKTFKNPAASSKSQTPPPPSNPNNTEKTRTESESTVNQQEQTAQPSAPDMSAIARQFIADDEEILIGNCRGMKFSEAKNNRSFKSFMQWIRTASVKSDYSAEKADQFRRLKQLALAVA